MIGIKIDIFAIFLFSTLCWWNFSDWLSSPPRGGGVGKSMGVLSSAIVSLAGDGNFVMADSGLVWFHVENGRQTEMYAQVLDFRNVFKQLVIVPLAELPHHLA